MRRSESIRIFRPVASESVRSLEVFNDAKKLFPAHEVRGKKELGVSIIESTESDPQNGVFRESGQAAQKLERVLYPYPKTGANPLELEVTDVAFLGKHLGRKSLALLLNDPEGILESERALYLRRMKKQFAKHLIPHVSVLSLDSTGTTRDVLSWAESNAPATITLDAITTYPEVPASDAVRYARTEAAKRPQSSRSLENFPIKDLSRLPTIPAILLNTLRKPAQE